MESNAAPPESLAGKLQRIEDLAEKLVYIKWSREFFVLLQRAAQDVVTLTQARPEQRQVAVLAERLQQQISECLEHGELPHGAQRERLIAVVDALCRTAPAQRNSVASTNPPAEERTVPLFSRWDKSTRSWPSAGQAPAEAALLWLATPDPARALIRAIERRGAYRVQRIRGLTEAHALLAQAQQPVAILVDLDDASDYQMILQQATTLRQVLPKDIPLLFMAARSDITARLEAVEAGAAGYFLKPVDLPLLLETLKEWMPRPLHHRILIMDDTLPSAREIARWLDGRGMVTQILVQPMLVLQALSNFRPDLLLVSLDFTESDSLLLVQAIRQHELFRELPLILCSAHDEMGPRLAATRLHGEMLLDKPLDPEILVAAIAKCLRQGNDLYRKISRLSNRDTVSGLYNRPYFLTHLERVLVTASANAQSVAVMLVALDNLRSIENQDIAATDEVIEQAAWRLKTALGPDVIAARFGDAIFMVLLAYTTHEGLLATARKAQTSLETEAYRLASGDFRLATSVGVSTAPSNAAAPCEASTLIQQADLARSIAQTDKAARIHIHHAQGVDQGEDQSRQRRLMEEIREAVQQQRMTLLFQPVVSLRGDTTERYEVLLRMRNHEGWELLPETVFALVKRHRIGMVLDRWVIAHAIRVLRERKNQGQPVMLFINISPTILQDEELLNWLQAGLNRTGVAASSLVFEMAETAADLNKQALLPFLHKLKALGCGLSLDHFSGHEHARSLVEFLQVNYVKLSSTFTQNLLNNKDIQQRLAGLTRSLADVGVISIVTGIEDAMTLPVLWSCGIDYVQGYFLQRPQTEMSYDFENMVL